MGYGRGTLQQDFWYPCSWAFQLPNSFFLFLWVELFFPPLCLSPISRLGHSFTKALQVDSLSLCELILHCTAVEPGFLSPFQGPEKIWLWLYSCLLPSSFSFWGTFFICFFGDEPRHSWATKSLQSFGDSSVTLAQWWRARDLNKFGYLQVPGLIPAGDTGTQIHMDLSK